MDKEIISEYKTKKSYVMYDKNQSASGNLQFNPDNHWTNFSMRGMDIVKVTRLDCLNMKYCKIYPIKTGIDPLEKNKTANALNL